MFGSGHPDVQWTTIQYIKELSNEIVGANGRVYSQAVPAFLHAPNAMTVWNCVGSHECFATPRVDRPVAKRGQGGSDSVFQQKNICDEIHTVVHNGVMEAQKRKRMPPNTTTSMRDEPPPYTPPRHDDRDDEFVENAYDMEHDNDLYEPPDFEEATNSAYMHQRSHRRKKTQKPRRRRI